MRAGSMPSQLADELGENRLVALSARPRDVMQDERAVAVEADRRLLLGDAAAARRLEEEGAADAANLAAPRRLRAPRGKAAPVALALGPVDEAGEIVAVEHRAGRRLVGDLLLGDGVAPPDLPGIDAERRRRLVDEALDDERRLGPARAAIGVGRRGVGHHLQVAAIDGRDAIGPAGHGEAVHRVGEDAGLAQIGAGIAQPARAQREEPPVLVEGELARDADGAAMIVGEEILGPGRAPFDRAAEALRQMQEQRMLGIRRGARAERAADIDHVDAHLIRRHAEHDGERVAHRRAALMAAPESRSAPIRRRMRRARRASPSCWARRAGFRASR